MARKRGLCRGCGEEERLFYGLCMSCRLTAAHKRPLNPRYKASKRVREARERSKAVLLQNREFLVCGCDYMESSLSGDTQSHDPRNCPNKKIITVARGHDNGK
jgi:hypothetical protein